MTASRGIAASNVVHDDVERRPQITQTSQETTPLNLLDNYLTVKGALQSFKTGSDEPDGEDKQGATAIEGLLLGCLPDGHTGVDAYYADDRYEEEDIGEQPIQELVSSVAHLAASCKVFWAGGSVRVKAEDADKVVLEVAKPDAQAAEFTPVGQINKLDGEELAKLCAPAPFGDLAQRRTVHDPAVRIAGEANFRLVSEGDSAKAVPFLQSMERDILKKLIKDEGASIALEPYRLNVYGPGGFFKPHVDTPNDPGRFVGTLIVALPCEFTGGQLEMRHGFDKQTFDMTYNRGWNPKGSVSLEWAALYGDCLHEVLPVKSGHRATLTYRIVRQNVSASAAASPSSPLTSERKRKREADDEETDDEEGNSLDAAKEEVMAAVRGLSALSKPPEYIGFILKHKYTRAGLTPAMLKGADWELNSIFAAAGWESSTLTVLIHHSEQRSDGEFGEPDLWGDYVRQKVYALGEQDFAYMIGQAAQPGEYTFKGKTVFFWFGNGGDELSKNNSSGGHQGNHYEPAQRDGIYLHGALVVKVPQEVKETAAAMDK